MLSQTDISDSGRNWIPVYYLDLLYPFKCYLISMRSSFLPTDILCGARHTSTPCCVFISDSLIAVDADTSPERRVHILTVRGKQMACTMYTTTLMQLRTYFHVLPDMW